MAIARMSHIRLVGLRSQQNRIVDRLVARGLFEARATDATEYDIKSGGDGLCDELKLKQSKIAFALDFLKARHSIVAAAVDNNEKEVKKGIAKPIGITVSKEKYSDARALITRADFSDARAREYELLDVCDTLQRISFRIEEDRSRSAAISNTIKTYEPFAPSPVVLSQCRRSGDVRIFIFQSAALSNAEEVLSDFKCAYDIRRENGAVITVACRADSAEEIVKSMGAIGYVRCTLDDDCTAAQKIDALKAEFDDVARHIFSLNVKALEYEKYVKDLRILYDVIGLEIECAEAERKFLKTDSAFILEGWLPEVAAQSVVDEVKAECPDVLIQLLAPEERDEPPTLVQNIKAVQPYEEITNMYSAPNYKEIDPNPIMSIFYFLFFGIMIGDAAYGLVLAVVGMIIGTSKKFDTGFKRLALLVGMGGISAIVWGILFGGYFSIDFGDSKIALWFNPLDDPMTMLVLSIVLGCVQMVAGYLVKFVALCKNGKPFSAIFDAGSIIILFGALGCLAVNMFLLETPLQGLTIAAITLAALGVGLILFFGGRNSKNIFGKALGGFKGLYGLVNLLSDVLSYCRLFGLGLASCAIGLAFNSLGGILFEIPYVGYIIGVIVLIPLHAFNLGIGVLSAYVHDARLQFLEFYGKFYEGGGRLFSPLGAKTKYIRYQ